MYVYIEACTIVWATFSHRIVVCTIIRMLMLSKREFSQFCNYFTSPHPSHPLKKKVAEPN